MTGWNWEEVGWYFSLASFIILLALVTIAFHHTPVLPEWLPESCVLIVLGVAVGAILKWTRQLPDPPDLLPPRNCSDLSVGSELHTRGHHQTEDNKPPIFPTFTPELFFFLLLPPVILESAYSLYDFEFASNIGTVLLYAVVGTLFNTFTIGPALYGLAAIGAMGSTPLMELKDSNFELGMADALVFSSLISAVDPVAVLAIFQETHIDRGLYFLVFGESLLNDAVTVGLYHTMLQFAEVCAETPGAGPVVVACLKLVAIGVGGLFIGLLYGCGTALITKTTSNVRVLEPLLLLGLSYMAYVTAELFRLSGIIGIIGCGLLQAHYAFKNISAKSRTTVKYFTKMASALSEAIIFLFLGVALFGADHHAHGLFIFYTILLCLMARFASVFILTWVANKRRVRVISGKEQFMMAYGGLRGAICFSLVNMLPLAGPRPLFLSATLAVIFFTAFVQSTTIKPLMKVFRIKEAGDKHGTMLHEINENVQSLLLAGIEQIAGVSGQFSYLSKARFLDEKLARPWLLSSRALHENSVLRAYKRNAINELEAASESRGRSDSSVVRRHPKPSEDPQTAETESTSMAVVSVGPMSQIRTTATERRQMRKLLSRRPTSLLLRHDIDEEEDLHQEEEIIRLRNRATRFSMVPSGTRQQTRANFDNLTYNWTQDEA